MLRHVACFATRHVLLCIKLSYETYDATKHTTTRGGPRHETCYATRHATPRDMLRHVTSSYESLDPSTPQSLSFAVLCYLFLLHLGTQRGHVFWDTDNLVEFLRKNIQIKDAK